VWRRGGGQGGSLSSNPLSIERAALPDAPAADEHRASRAEALQTATVDQFRRLAVWLILVSALVAIALTISLRVSVTPADTLMIVWVLAALLLASRIWWERSGQQRLADTSGTVAVVSLGAMTCGAIAMLQLRLHFPLADPMLHRADLALGIDGVAIATMVARHHDLMLPVVALIYNNTLQLFFCSLILLSLTRDRVEAWRAALTFVGTLLTTCAVAAFIPATGLINWVPSSVLAFLPRAFMAHFEEFYYGVHPLLRLQVVDGVITFPSFHAIVGFLTFAMWRKRLITRAVAAVWLTVELLSTVAGGHYVIDLIGGFLVWGAWFALSRMIEKRAADALPC
jgi:hypothetical protein